MKTSERLKKEAEQTDNDFVALGKYTKALREERKEKFEDDWLSLLKKQTEVTKQGYKYIFDSEYGIIDYYPKANKLLIRKKNKWVKPALKFIVNKIIKEQK